MANFFVRYPAAGGGGVEWSTPVDADVVPDGDGTRDLGSAAAPFDDIFGYEFRCPFSMSIYASNGSVDIYTLGEDANNEINIFTEERTGANNGASVNLYTGNSSSGNSGGVNLTTGNSSSGNSGGILLQPGTAVGGVRGSIKLKDGTEGTAGHVWTSSGVDGEGSWAAASAGSATSGAKIKVTAETAAYSSPAAVAFTSSDEIFDTGSVIGTNELVADTTGYYTLCVSGYAPTNNTSQFIQLYYTINGGANQIIAPTIFGSATAYAATAGSAQVFLTSGDTVQLIGYSTEATGKIGAATLSMVSH